MTGIIELDRPEVSKPGGIEYNTERPHSSLDDLTPEEFRDAHTSRRSANRVRENLKNIVSLTPDSTSIPY
jgi:hypothetical protein